MDKQSLNNQDQSRRDIDSEEAVSKIEIYIDKEGHIGYNCDWEPSAEGIGGISAILYKLLLSDLGLKIFDEIKAQCVLNDSEEDFRIIEDTIRRYSMLDDEMREINDDDDIVVPPDQILEL
mgnify:CR=1 FL=1